MIARAVVLTAVFLAWLPAFVFMLISKSPLVLLLPVMGFCPSPDRSGEPGYCESCAYAWGAGFLVVYALLGSWAFWIKSTSLSVIFAVLLLTSVLLTILRAWGSINGLSNH